MPSSTSCITSVLVQSLVMDPIWKTESGVASTPGGQAQHAGGVVDDLAVREDGHGRGRDVVLLDQPGQLVGDPGLHLVQGAHGATPYERLPQVRSSYSTTNTPWICQFARTAVEVLEAPGQGRATASWRQ